MDLVNSIVKAVRILDLLKAHGSLSYSEILKMFPLPKGTLFKILFTLESEELIRRDQVSGKYELGVKLIEWGTGARSQLEIRKIALPLMQKLSEDINCTIHLTVVSHGEVLPIESFESGNTTWPHYLFHGGIGIPAPLHATAAGKAILAFMSDDELENTLNGKELQKFTENTITTMSHLREALAEIRQTGYAVSYSEHHEMVRGIAAPIRDSKGKVFASLSALGITSRLTAEWLPEVALQVIAASNEISRLFGYSVSGVKPLKAVPHDH